VKIATFNINNINRRLPNLLNWLATAKPDAVCLQELKAEDWQFPRTALREAGYGAVWQGERRWNGVAILGRGAEPVLTRRSLPGDPADKQSRYIEAAVNGVLIACTYLPNGNPQPGPKFDYKLAWFERRSCMPPRCWPPTRRSYWQVTSTSCQPTSTSTARGHG
jgi:exodeoxyribonuclease-3